ncbi:MAG: hypothetical protein A2452_05900 [Candidatus Firestonebacteria bacterium RIFOXYC2_FULL_39_67]|nr:MAG: hypothetical protein A2536_12565 [Candidatus Firestonebacteria bacterium RIFOXYD2_FULL_39_29]OGF56622.1 MAG: hypothetical protein A2452_05900 [Candidatus Firestonebacteria bacterium RIFOXYC2_FULL_39_67]
MKVLDFKVILEAETDGGYVVVCPAIPGCYSQGDTLEEAMRNIKEAIDLCIEDMKKHNEKLPDTSREFVGSVLVKV